MNADMLHSEYSCLVPFENYCTDTEKYISLFENFLDTKRTKYTKNEMISANVPRKKDNYIFSIKTNMIFDNLSEKYAKRLNHLCERYENEISDVYKIGSINQSPKGKFKGLSEEAFSKISSASKYHRGKRNLRK